MSPLMMTSRIARGEVYLEKPVFCFLVKFFEDFLEYFVLEDIQSDKCLLKLLKTLSVTDSHKTQAKNRFEPTLTLNFSQFFCSWITLIGGWPLAIRVLLDSNCKQFINRAPDGVGLIKRYSHSTLAVWLCIPTPSVWASRFNHKKPTRMRLMVVFNRYIKLSLIWKLYNRL